MLRLIIKTIDASHCPHVGGSPLESFKTFDVSLPEVEAFLAGFTGFSYVNAHLVGVELIKTE